MEICCKLVVSMWFLLCFPLREIAFFTQCFSGQIDKFNANNQNVNASQRTARDFLQWLGIVASCIDLIPNARLYMRPIQLHLLSFWKPSFLDLEKIIPITQHLIQHLQWWLHSVNISRGRSLQLEETGVTITTDASFTGYGGHLNNQIVQGKWDKRHKYHHINCIEMEAVFLSLKHFQKQIQNKTVLIRCDNTTVVQYINKQEGTKSPLLC
mgnify:CR=1 FL=1